MFDDNEDIHKPKVAHTLGEDLAALSIDELEERIGLLKSEIERLAEAIAAKRTSADHAASFFRQ